MNAAKILEKTLSDAAVYIAGFYYKSGIKIIKLKLHATGLSRKFISSVSLTGFLSFMYPLKATRTCISLNISRSNEINPNKEPRIMHVQACRLALTALN